MRRCCVPVVASARKERSAGSARIDVQRHPHVSVPLGISTPNEPNISSTRWRVVADHKNRVYYHESSLTPNTFWLDLKDIDFSRGTEVRKLSVINQEVYSGNAVRELKAAKPFQFMGTD